LPVPVALRGPGLGIGSLGAAGALSAPARWPGAAGRGGKYRQPPARILRLLAGEKPRRRVGSAPAACF